MFMHMIGKLSKDQKADGPSIYQSWSMLRILQDQPSLGTAHVTWCLGADHTYLSISTSQWYGAQGNTNVLTILLMSYVNDCKNPLKKCKSSPLLRLRDRSDTVTERLMLYYWSQAIPTKERRKWRTGGKRNHMKQCARSQRASICISWRMSRQDAHEFSTETDVSHFLCEGYSPLYSHASWADRVHHHHPRGTNFR